MIAGNIGSSSIMSYTVIGDNVNLGLAARVAEQGIQDPHYHQRRHARPARRALTTSGRSATSIVKGKTRPVAIFEVVVPSPIPARTRTQAYEDTLVLACALRASTATPGVRTARQGHRQRSNKAADQAQKVRRSEDLRRGRAPDRRSRSAASCATKFGVYQDEDGHEVRHAGRHRAGPGEHTPEPEVGVHRPRHRRRERLRRAGGIVHITRGVLGLIRTKRSWPACSATRSPTSPRNTRSTSIQKSNAHQAGADDGAGKGGLAQMHRADRADAAYNNIVENGFDRDDENEADEIGVQLANKVGYDARRARRRS